MSNTLMNLELVEKFLQVKIEDEINALAEKMVDEIVEKNRESIKKTVMNAAILMINSTYNVSYDQREVVIRVEHRDR